MQVHRAARLLRTELFRAKDRETTDKVVIGYTGTLPLQNIDAAYIDGLDCRAGFLGCTWHYVIGTSGKIEIGRHPATMSSRTRTRRFHRQAIFIGVVGGKEPTEGYNVQTITSEQEASAEWLVQELADTYGNPLEITDQVEGWGSYKPGTNQSATASQRQQFIDGIYSEMTADELAASPDRVTV